MVVHWILIIVPSHSHKMFLSATKKGPIQDTLYIFGCAKMYEAFGYCDK